MSSSPHHVQLPVPPVAGVKRPAPSLLPAFEPSSSSPKLPRPAKHLNHASPSKTVNRERFYPTPVPTSSTLIPSSSPPKAPQTRRPGLGRTLSTFSERAPLSTVPSIELSEHGEPTLMGRSSNSSHYQLSTNKLISRIHVRAVYVAAKPPEAKKIQVECMGWNGVKVHCQGKAWELLRGDTFTSETEDVDIMVDVHDARVLLTWPKPSESKIATPTDSDSAWDSEISPQRATAGVRTRAPYTSPLRQQHRLQSPISPSPARHTTHLASSGFMASNPPVAVPVKIYEDEPLEGDQGDGGESQQPTQATQVLSQPFGNVLQEIPSSPLEEFSDHDEENDPIIASFGPYGANLGARMESLAQSSPARQPLNPLKDESISPQRQGSTPKRRRHNKDRDVSDSAHKAESNPITNHVINQLAYSRLSSTPMSTLMQNLPSHMTSKVSTEENANKTFTDEDLKSILENTPCIGTVEREGKDAAGKRLESEYYYIPEEDADEGRKEMVEGLGGRGLRNCRKSHKVITTAVSDLKKEADRSTAILLAKAEIVNNPLSIPLDPSCIESGEAPQGYDDPISRSAYFSCSMSLCSNQVCNDCKIPPVLFA
ncbi:target of SBF [Lecanora helva]